MAILTPQDVASRLIPHLPTLKLLKNGEPAVTSRALPDGTKMWEEITKNLVTPATELFIDTIETRVKLGEDILLCCQVREEIKKRLETEKTARENAELLQGLQVAEDFRLDIGFREEHSSLKDLNILVERGSSNLYAYSLITRKNLPIHSSNLPRIGKGNEALAAAIESRKRVVDMVYHPSLPPHLFEVTERQSIEHNILGAYAFNSYIAPQWKANRIEGVAKLPAPVARLLEFLFKDKLCREHVYRWIHTLLYCHDSLAPIMILVSDRGGVGKGRFVRDVLTPLVGESNIGTPPASQTGRFDTHFFGCHLYYAAEAHMDEKAMNRMKEIYDLWAANEQKFKSTGKAQRIAGRYILSTNFLSHIYMTYDSRKFTVPDIERTRPLRDYLTPEEQDYLTNLKYNNPALAEIAAWFKENSGPLEFEETWQKEIFVDLCEAHLPVWFRSFIAYLEHSQTFKHKDFRKVCHRRDISVMKVKELVKWYEAVKNPICNIVRSPNGQDDGVVYESKIFKGEIDTGLT